MNELESILNYLETTSMEPHDDYTSEFSYKEQKVLWKYIKQLQQENKKYKEVIDTLEFIKARAKEGATQETINKLAITFVNKYLKGVE